MRVRQSRTALWRCLGIVLCAGVLSAWAWADTLELRDGRVLHGQLVSRNDQGITFAVNGEEQHYPLSEVKAVSFDDQTTPAGDQTTPALRTGRPERTTAAHTTTVPAGTAITVRMVDSVDSAKNRVGDRFRATLEDDLAVDGTVVAPKGTDVFGRLSEAREAGHLGGSSELKLELTGIAINGQTEAISTGDYQMTGKGRGGNTVKKVGGGAALGALVGAIAGGGKGAAIGAAAGAGAGTAVQVLTRGEQVRVPSETILTFELEQPLTVSMNP